MPFQLDDFHSIRINAGRVAAHNRTEFHFETEYQTNKLQVIKVFQLNAQVRRVKYQFDQTKMIKKLNKRKFLAVGSAGSVEEKRNQSILLTDDFHSKGHSSARL